MSADPIPPLDQTIAAAVSARVEAEVLAALAGDEVMGKYVAAALAQTVTVKKPQGYGDMQVPYLKATLDNAIREATKAAVIATIQAELPTIQTEVEKALRRNIKGIAEALTTNLHERVGSGYGVNVELHLRMPNE